MKHIFTIFLFISSSLLASTNLQKVSLQFEWKHQFEFAGFYIAKEKGFYKDVGLEVELKEYEANVQITDDVMSGKTTFGINYPNIIYERANGKDLVLLSTVLQSSPLAFVTLDSSGINSVEDFKDKNLMINEDSMNVAPLISMLNSHNLSFDDMKKVPHTFNLDQLIAGKVDIVTVFTSNEPFVLEQKGIKHKIWDSKDFGFDFYDVILFTSAKQVKENPQMVQNFNNASIKGWEYAFENIEETIELILKKYNTQNKSKAALFYEAIKLKELAYYNTEKFGIIDSNKIQRIYDFYHILGFTKNRLDMDGFILNPTNSALSAEEKHYIQNNHFNVCLRKDHEPIISTSQNELRGLAGDLFNALNEKLQLHYKFKEFITQEKLHQEILRKQCDLVLPVSKDQKVYPNIKTSKSLFRNNYAVLGNLESQFFEQDKKDYKKIFYVKDPIHMQTIASKYPQLHVVLETNVEKILEKVEKNPNVHFISKQIILDHYITEHGYDTFKINDILDNAGPILGSIGINEQHTLLLSAINKSISNLERTITNPILEKYKYNYSIVKTDYTIVWFILGIFILTVLAIIYHYQNKINRELRSEKNGLLKNKHVGMCSLSGFKFTWVNEKFCEIYGYSAEELIGQSPRMLYCSDEDWEKTTKKIEDQFSKNEIANFEARECKKDGNTVDVQLSMTLLNADNFVVVVQDITEKKKQKQEILQQKELLKELNKNLQSKVQQQVKEIQEKEHALLAQQRLAQMGEMLQMIAHQWRQPLTTLNLDVEQIRFEMYLGDINEEWIENQVDIIVKKIKGLSQTINDFKNYFSPSKRAENFSLKKLVDNTLHVVDHDINHYSINVTTQIPSDLHITSFRGELGQALLVIFHNAKDEYAKNKPDERLLHIEVTQEDSNVKLTICDTAGGIPEDVMPKIWDPYFTTKEELNGSGIGLYMVKMMIEKSLDGKVQAYNNDKGACFEITLPMEVMSLH